MIEEDHHGVTLDRCVACGGLWFDVDEIYDYLRSHPALAAVHEPSEADFKRCTNGVGAKCTCCGQSSVELGDFRGIAYQRCTWCGGLFIGPKQICEIVASRAGQVTIWGPEGEFNSEAYVAGGLAAATVTGGAHHRSAGDLAAGGLSGLAEGGLELGAHALLEGGGELAGAALELVFDFVLAIIAGALGG
jgi:hypothetical protein